MCIEILKGNLKEAYYYNKLIFVMLPLLFVFFIKWSADYIKTGKIRHSKFEMALIIIMLVAFGMFGIIRNII